MPKGLLSGTFVAGTALTSIEALVYITVGLLLHASPRATQRLPWNLFVIWWILIGTNKLLSAAAGLGAAQGWVSADAFIAVIYVNLAILSVSLGCLMAYLLYLFTGSMRAARWTAAGYVGFYLLLTYNTTAGQPDGVAIGAWKAVHTSASQAPDAVRILVLALLFFPQVVGAILYASLRGKLTAPLARYRVALVPVAIVAWSVSIVLVALPAFAENTTMQVTSRIMGVAAGVLTLAAYRPPAFVRERLGAGETDLSATA